MSDSLNQLALLIKSRYQERPTGSYTTSLFEGGLPRMAQKVGEEGVEVVIAALSGEKHELISESADLLYHLLVLWTACGVTPDDVWQELASRK